MLARRTLAVELRSDAPDGCAGDAVVRLSSRRICVCPIGTSCIHRNFAIRMASLQRFITVDRLV
jgi:hypothetical protein